MKNSELVTIGWAYGTFDAYLAVSMLQSAGIPVFAQALHHANANWSLSHALGGIAIQIPASEAPVAWEILEDFTGNTARRWRRWYCFAFAVIVFLWMGLPPPSNGYTPAARWLPARSAAPRPETA